MIPPRSPIYTLLDANAKWADAVDTAEPGFFAKSAQGQYPKVPLSSLSLEPLTTSPNRSSGSDAPTRASQSLSSPVHAPVTSLSTVTSPSKQPHRPLSYPCSPRNTHSQFHPDDDSALAVLSYAVGVVGVEHGTLSHITQAHILTRAHDRVQSYLPDIPTAEAQQRVIKPLRPVLSPPKNPPLPPEPNHPSLAGSPHSQTSSRPSTSPTQPQLPPSTSSCTKTSNAKSSIFVMPNLSSRRGPLASPSGSMVGCTMSRQAESRTWACPAVLGSRKRERIRCNTLHAWHRILSESTITTWNKNIG